MPEAPPEAAPETSTLHGVRPVALGPPVQKWRRLGIAVLLVVVLAGATGYLGVHRSSESIRTGGWTLTLTYPQVARAGLDVPWRVAVHSAASLPPTLTLAVSANYFRMFETQGFFPTPSAVTDNGTFVYLTFTTQPGHDFLVDYDAYIQPAQQIGTSGTVQLIVHGVVEAQQSFRTWLLP
jgi:hypothetical protein